MLLSLHYGLNLVDPKAYGGWEGDLNACVADAAAMAALMARAGFEARATLNEDATLASLDTALKTYADRMITGDTLVLSFSGHGGRSGPWVFTYRETLCFYDGQLADTALHSWLTRFRAGVNLVIILDACHSGGMDRDPQHSKVRAAPPFISRASRVLLPSPVNPEPRTLNPETRQIADIQTRTPQPATRSTPSALFLTACRADEVASDGDLNGAFTSSLLTTATAIGLQNITWQNWHTATAAYMAKTFPTQHPCLITTGPKDISASYVCH